MPSNKPRKTEEERKAAKRAWHAKYRKTPKYKEMISRYLATEAGHKAHFASARKSTGTKDAAHRQRLAVIKNFFGCMSGHCKWTGALSTGDIDFHHIERTSKLFNVALMARHSDGHFVDEVNKCTCLCAICHRKVERGEITPIHMCSVSVVDGVYTMALIPVC